MITGIEAPRIRGAAHNGPAYDASSHTQHTQGELIVHIVSDMVALGELPEAPRVVDVGCGNGRTTLEICRELPSGAVIVGIDISESQIQTANHNLQQARAAGVVLPENITFAVADATAIGSNPETSNLDLVVSNAALHWVPRGGAYKPIYDALAHDGAIAINQGGEGCYRGLARVALEAAKEIGVGDRFNGWKYPLYYPSSNGIKELLKGIGYKHILVDSRETDGTESTNLIANYSNAGLLPFIERAGDKGQELKGAFLAIAGAMQASGHLDRYTHRLHIDAKK